MFYVDVEILSRLYDKEDNDAAEKEKKERKRKKINKEKKRKREKEREERKRLLETAMHGKNIQRD